MKSGKRSFISLLPAATLVAAFILSGCTQPAEEVSTVSYSLDVGHLRAQITEGTGLLFNNAAFVSGDTDARLVSGREGLELLDAAGYAEAERPIDGFATIRRVLQAEGAVAVYLPSHAVPDQPDDYQGLLYIPSPSTASFETGDALACSGTILYLSRGKVFDDNCNNRVCQGAINRSDPHDKCNRCICSNGNCLPPLDCGECSSGSSGPDEIIERALERCGSFEGCNPEQFRDQSALEELVGQRI